MAQTIPCDICEQEPAVMLLTNIATTDIQGIGGNCAALALRAIADTLDAASAVPTDQTPDSETEREPETGSGLEAAGGDAGTEPTGTPDAGGPAGVRPAGDSDDGAPSTDVDGAVDIDSPIDLLPVAPAPSVP